MIIAGQCGIRLPAALHREGALARSSLLTMTYAGTLIVLLAAYYSAQLVAGR